MSLHSALSRIDMSAPAIQEGAGTMMKHYDRSAGTAVTEWRNALQIARDDQLLPLLYVANEVLQTSKRNRGNNFLEAFSATLGQALAYMCQRLDPEQVEKVRRTAKIWGDRRVFSVRYVGELLKGLEPYRNGNIPKAQAMDTSMSNHVKDDDGRLASFSPTPSDEAPASPKPTQREDEDISRSEITASPTADDLMRQSSDEENDDDEDSIGFFRSSGDAQLDVTIDASKVEEVTLSPKKMRSPPSAAKRRRSSTGGGSRKRKSLLSTQSLQDLWRQLSLLQQQYDQSQTLLKGMDPNDLGKDGIEDLIGDQLLEAYERNVNYTKLLNTERANLHRVANGKRNLEQEAIRYLPWCHTALQQDDEDLELCNSIEQDLVELKTIHKEAKERRDERKAKQEQAARQQQIEKQKQLEEEERKRLLEAALSKQEEAKPGMVWSKAAQEYVYLNTEEDWRD
mmetsp:Transcript_27925/g.41225  ORF Transcript_27925/g.41225 Transcript_27925/m.41225 type:complete len:454 (+) Transcript_27925:414-1775(+)